jgi:hypothetical protein
MASVSGDAGGGGEVASDVLGSAYVWWNYSLGRPLAPETTIFRRYGTVSSASLRVSVSGAEADKAITTIVLSMQALLARREVEQVAVGVSLSLLPTSQVGI